MTVFQRVVRTSLVEKRCIEFKAFLDDAHDQVDDILRQSPDIAHRDIARQTYLRTHGFLKAHEHVAAPDPDNKWEELLTEKKKMIKEINDYVSSKLRDCQRNKETTWAKS